MSGKELQRQLGVTYKTAWRMGQQIRMLMGSVDEFVARASGSAVTVRTPEASRLRELLLGPDVTITTAQSDVLQVQGLTAEQIGTVAWQEHLPIFELATQQAGKQWLVLDVTNLPAPDESVAGMLASKSK